MKPKVISAPPQPNATFVSQLEQLEQVAVERALHDQRYLVLVRSLLQSIKTGQPMDPEAVAILQVPVTELPVNGHGVPSPVLTRVRVRRPVAASPIVPLIQKLLSDHGRYSYDDIMARLERKLGAGSIRGAAVKSALRAKPIENDGKQYWLPKGASFKKRRWDSSQ